MKRVVLGLVLSALAGTVNAIPIPFQFSGSSISATGSFAVGSYTPTAGGALLDNGESAGFVFGTLTALGAGFGDLTVNVNFVSPASSTEGVTGEYGLVSIGLFASGKWTGGTKEFGYSYLGSSGVARLSMSPIDVSCMFCVPTFQFRGSLTNLGSEVTGGGSGPGSTVSVPEPATVLLLGIGLVALGLLGRLQRSR